MGLPAALLQVELHAGPAAPKSAILLVQGFSRQVEMPRSQPLRLEPIPTSVRRFIYPLADEETLELARQSLARFRLSRVLSVGYGSRLELKIRGVVHQPYWVLYEQRAGGRMEFRIVDAVNGCVGGVLLREALLRALDHESRRTDDRRSVAPVR